MQSREIRLCVKVKRVHPAEEIQDSQPLDTLQAEAAVAIVEENRPITRRVSRLPRFDPLDERFRIDEEQHEWRKQKEKNRRDMECGPQHELKGDAEDDSDDACAWEKEEKRQRELKGETGKTQSVTQRRLLGQDAAQWKLSDDADRRIVHERIVGIIGEPISSGSEFAQGRVPERPGQLELKKPLDEKWARSLVRVWLSTSKAIE